MALDFFFSGALRKHGFCAFPWRSPSEGFGGDCVNLSFAAFRTGPIAKSTCTGSDIADLDSKPHRAFVPYAVGCVLRAARKRDHVRARVSHCFRE